MKENGKRELLIPLCPPIDSERKGFAGNIIHAASQLSKTRRERLFVLNSILYFTAILKKNANLRIISLVLVLYFIRLLPQVSGSALVELEHSLKTKYICLQNLITCDSHCIFSLIRNFLCIVFCFLVCRRSIGSR